VAMLSWGFGDFMIQRSAKKLGDWETLFFITAFGTIVLVPFVWRELPSLFVGSGNNLFILISAALLLLAASLLTFEGYKKGKISVLEPLLSFEIVSASLLSLFILRDHVGPLQIGLIVVLMVGLFLVSTRERVKVRSFFVEKGVFIFLLGSIIMGGADFLLGWGSRTTDPLMANFIMNIVMATVSGLFILANPESRASMREIRANRALLLVMSIADNIAWIAYAFAMVTVPIAIATGLSESSTIIAVLLGLFVNKERLQRHQKIGLVVAVASVTVLAVVTAG